MTGHAERIECPECGSRATMIGSSYGNKSEIECHDCGNEWEHYTGEECPRCNSRNTKQYKHRGTFRQFTKFKCFDCGHEEQR